MNIKDLHKLVQDLTERLDTVEANNLKLERRVKNLTTLAFENAELEKSKGAKVAHRMSGLAKPVRITGSKSLFM
jgi:hypothetical protein